MTGYGRIGMWVLGGSILTYGCTTTTSGNGEQLGQGAGAIGAAGNGNGNGNGTGTGTGNGNGGVLGGGTAVASGGREPPLVSVQKAVLTSAVSCQPENGASPCTTCILQNCCTQTTACWQSVGSYCASLAGCMAKCADDACVRDCTKQFDNGEPAGCITQCDGDGNNCTQDCSNHEEGTPDYQPVLDCANSYCGSVCNNP